MSCSKDGEIRIWNANTGELLGQPLLGHTQGVNCISFSPTGELLASGSSDKTVRLWDVQKGCIVDEPLQGHRNRVYSIAWSPSGILLVTGSRDGSIRLWHVQTRQTIFELQGHQGDVTSVVFSPDGSKLASASWDETIRLWDVYSGQCIGNPLRGHNDIIQSVAFSPDGQLLVSGSWDKTLRIWAIEKPRKISLKPCPKLATPIGTLPPSSVIMDTVASDYVDHADEDGWIRATTGERVVWVPIPGGHVNVEGDTLTIEGPGKFTL